MPELRNLTLPDLAELELDWPDIDTVIREYLRLTADHRTASTDLAALLESRPAAINEDRQTYAKAIRQGKNDPGEAALAKLNTKITASSRKVEALAVAVQAAAQDLADAVERRRIELVRDTDRAVLEDHAALSAAVAQWEVARGRLHAHRALRSWVRGFPTQTKYVPGMTPPLAGLTGRNGAPVSYAEIAQSLRQDAEPPAVADAV